VSEKRASAARSFAAALALGAVIAVAACSRPAEWMRTLYHTPRDDLRQRMDLESSARHAQANFLIGYDVASRPERRDWNPGDFFGEKFGTTRSP
jgi:hypothetical protein